MTAPELKPCPFCGGNASISKDHDPDGNGAFYAIKCRKCRAKSSEIYAVETCNIHFTQVRDAWNRRAVQPAQVRVKPLVWDDFAERGAKAQEWNQANYLIQKWSDGRWEISASYPGYSTSVYGIDRFHPTIEAAKAAAMADYEARILAAIEPQVCPECSNTGLRDTGGVYPWGEGIFVACDHDEPQPDPRDEVIKGLVDAATDAAEAIDMAYGSDDDESPHRHSAKLRAALAAAKEIR